MRRSAFLVVVMLLVLAAASPVVGRAKDPFLPPGTSGSQGEDGAGGAQAPGLVRPPDRADPGDGIARTGQDVGIPFATGLGLLAFGVALRLVAQAAHPRIRPGARNFGGRTRLV